MKLLLAPDKLKGTFAAREVCRLLAEGARRADPRTQVIEAPMADGGEGTLDVVTEALEGKSKPLAGEGPFGEAVRARVGVLPGGEVLVESAHFCGAPGVPSGRRDPMRATSHGLGRALYEVLSWSPASVSVGLGGSLTVDGGLGLARALGFRLVGPYGRTLDGLGEDLVRLEAIEPPARPPAGAIPVRALADVRTRLADAVRLFAPQKGAAAEDLPRLEAGLVNLARIAERDLGVELESLEGGGAAGGLGAGLVAFLGAGLRSGAESVASWIGLAGLLDSRPDLVVTAEGRFEPAHEGKVADFLLRESASRGLPCLVICASTGEGRPADGDLLVLGGKVTADDLVRAGKVLVGKGFSANARRSDRPPSERRHGPE
ncbi:MAG TPA: glycerate kinase [Candidatus Saccharimonadales bacterium]|nr:glycerate kinase [Candidatus Saccharimonadales bacterium]